MAQKKKDPVNKKKKGVATDLFEKTQPIRDAVSEVAFSDDTSSEELAYVQNELRRLSRVVKKARANQSASEEA